MGPSVKVHLPWDKGKVDKEARVARLLAYLYATDAHFEMFTDSKKEYYNICGDPNCIKIAHICFDCDIRWQALLERTPTVISKAETDEPNHATSGVKDFVFDRFYDANDETFGYKLGQTFLMWQTSAAMRGEILLFYYTSQSGAADIAENGFLVSKVECSEPLTFQ